MKSVKKRILLVEPDYNNKYPPIGLMKIATYHRNKGDYVEFFKGKAPYPKIITFDRVYITTLFTFYFQDTVDTINHYRSFIDDEKIFVGGIAASIMPDKFRDKIGNVIVQTGQRRTSNDLGYDDEINIDRLPLDYDILDDVQYRYPSADNYFAYATRGCSNKCKFCAVPILEPVFEETNDVIDQVEYVRERYGDKRNILLMDNNVLCSVDLQKLMDDLNSLGFIPGCKNFVRPNFFEIAMKKIDRRIQYGNTIQPVVKSIVDGLHEFGTRTFSIKDQPIFDLIMSDIESCEVSGDIIKVLNENREWLSNLVDRRKSAMKMQRFVDFNQGIDARLLSDEKMSILSKIPVAPFRLAYDNFAYKDIYEKAFRVAYSHGVRQFSNYMLYNYNESPEELWKRMDHNVRLKKEVGDVTLFSFPMRYAPIDRIDRAYVGEHWSKKQLDAMNLILNVTKGVVMGEDDFFYRAYGHTPKEFLKVLAMPGEFIKYRSHFDQNGLNDRWGEEYDFLSEDQKVDLIDVLSNKDKSIPAPLESIMKYYSMKKASIL